jgi:hypothetical protein
MDFKNNVFISYAADDKSLAKELEMQINDKLSDAFRAELVEDLKEGDVTFTEKVIDYFRICNIFIGIISPKSQHHIWVNQEIGYAKCLKEQLGQIQLLIYVIEKNIFETDIHGFISPNMKPIFMELDASGNPNTDEIVSMIFCLLKSKEDKLIPILPERQNKLRRFSNELNGNLALNNKLINEKNDFLTRLSMEPNPFEINYALQIVDQGHLFDMDFINKIEKYIGLINELNIWKRLAIDWAICRGKYHEDNTEKLYKLLDDSGKPLEDLVNETEQLKKLYFK